MPSALLPRALLLRVMLPRVLICPRVIGSSYLCEGAYLSLTHTYVHARMRMEACIILVDAYAWSTINIAVRA